MLSYAVYLYIIYNNLYFYIKDVQIKNISCFSFDINLYNDLFVSQSGH